MQHRLTELATGQAVRLLLAAADLPRDITEQIDWLVVAKSQTHEKANGVRFAALDRLILTELRSAPGVPGRRHRASEIYGERASQLFLDLVNHP